MAKKDDHQSLGDDLGLPQHRFLLGLSSGLLDIMPLPGTMLAQSKLSNDAINDIIFPCFRFAYRIGAA